MVVYFVRSAMFVSEEKVLANQGEVEKLWNVGTAWTCFRFAQNSVIDAVNFFLLILIEYYNSLFK